MNYEIVKDSLRNGKVLVKSLEYPNLCGVYMSVDANGDLLEQPVFNPPKSATSKAAFYGQVQVTRRRWADDGRNAANRGVQ